MRQFFSFQRPKKEVFEGRVVMTDPGVHAPVAEALAQRLPKDARILEIGAGAGAFTLRLHRMGFQHIHAVDIDDQHFDIDEVTFTKVSATTPLHEQLKGMTFDAIVAVEVIEHVLSTFQFLKSAKELLAPGGFLFLTTPNICSFYSRIVFLKEGRYFHFQGKDSWEMGHINPVPFFVLEQLSDDMDLKQIFRQELGHMPVLNWSSMRLKTLLLSLPRLALFSMMKGPGPIDGNVLFYGFQINFTKY